MNGRDLKRLSDVADVAKLDLSPGAITLAPTDDGVLAWYSGSYAAGGVRATVSHTLDRAVSIAPDEFRQLATLFDDDAELRLSAEASALAIIAGKRRVTFRYLNTPDIETYAPLQEAPELLRCSRSDFSREINFASDVSSVALTVPILTGLHLIMSSKLLGVQAANGSSLVFETAIAAQGPAERIDLVTPSSDMLIALRVLGDASEVAIGVLGKSIVLRTDGAIAKLATLGGTWPKMEQLRTLKFDEETVIPPALIRSLTLAARAYKASNDAIIRNAGSGQIVLETVAAETGQFQETLAGSVSRTYTFDVADLDIAAKLGTKDVDLRLSPTMALVRSGLRKLYINVRTV